MTAIILRSQYLPHVVLAESYEQRGEPVAAISFYQEALPLNLPNPILNRRVMKLWSLASVQERLPVDFVNV